MQPKTRAVAALDALGLAAVAALFVLWCVHTPDLTAAGGIAAGCSAALFAAAGLRFVPAWVRFWQREAASPAVPAQEPEHMGARIFAALLALDLVLLLLVIVAASYRYDYLHRIALFCFQITFYYICHCIDKRVVRCICHDTDTQCMIGFCVLISAACQ